MSIARFKNKLLTRLQTYVLLLIKKFVNFILHQIIWQISNHTLQLESAHATERIINSDVERQIYC